MFKKIIKFFILLIILWFIILFINILRINNYKEPILYSSVLSDEFSATYNCFGYKINTTKIRNIILRANLCFGNQKIFETKKREYQYDPILDQINIIE